MNKTIKKLIYKTLKKILKNSDDYGSFVKEIVEEDRIKFIEQLTKYPVFMNIVRDSIELKEIKNCILINSRFSNCRIKEITNNAMKNAYISNNFVNTDVAAVNAEVTYSE
jgi:hypothetical protein